MYVPARSALVAVESEDQEDEIGKKQLGELRRSGLVRVEDEDADALIEAWEKGEDKLYIPLKKTSKKEWNPENVASSAQMGRLYAHVRRTIADMAAELRGGTIEANPYFRSQQDRACEKCDFFEACRFAEGEAGEKSRRLRRLKADEVWALMEGEVAKDE